MRAEKGLGQNFLCSSSVIETILGSLEGFPGVLEIGPGPGVLTSRLADGVRQVVALELDPRMVSVLKVSAPVADVRLQDALKSDFAQLLSGLPAPKAVVGNIPYYITSPLLEKVAQIASEIDRAVLMMQREVADRIAAKAGDSARGSLSVYLQSRFLIEKLVDVPPDCFLPQPKVHSTVVQLTPQSTEGATEELFRVVRAGFSQPRKTLVNNLGAIAAKADVQELLIEMNLSSTVRPHELTYDQWARIASAIS